MLGVLKRRWKPKRSSNGGRLSVDACPTVTTGAECPVIGEKPRCVPVVPCARQVHPACEDRAHVLHAYDAYDVSVEHHNQHNNHITTSYQQPAYPLAPNICVEAGRIEFIKVPPDGGSMVVETPPPPSPLPPTQINMTTQTVVPPTSTPKFSGKVTVTRAQQTNDEEKFDVAKESLEAKIAELEEALEAAKITELRDKQTLMKLQKQLSKREASARDVERERRLRAESEARVREAAADAARCRTRLKLLTHEFARMEETVRAMLVYKSRAEQLKQEKTALAVAFENRTQQYQSTIGRLNQEVTSLRQQLESVSTCSTDGRVAALEADNAALSRDVEATRRQYERCLDDVANQVVRALLAQKNLREEITSLTRRLKDLESQNRALTTLLVHQLRGDNDVDLCSKTQLALESSPKSESIQNSSSTPEMQSTSDSNDHSSILLTSPSIDSTIKHCNSFNSDILSETKISPPEICNEKNSIKEIISRTNEKHLSADADILETRLSLEDKKRHHILAKLWTELKGTEVTPQRLLEALSVVDSSLWVPPQRPVSLNLQLPVFQTAKCHRRTRPVLAQSNSKSEEETGNESPESGNRDEGYSTMSSDVQGEVTRVSGEPGRGLEDLKEATDESDLPETRIMIVEDQCDPDILYIPLNFAFGINPRNSFPPSKGILPFQHIMRSFSDSHLCLKITTAPSPCYSLSSPISSSPSILLLDITDKSLNPLRRAKATTLLPSVEYLEEEPHSRISWCSAQDEHVDCTTWDTEYVQQWLRLDESRSALQQHQRDLVELEYDRAELEDWSLSLSSEDVHEAVWKKSNEILTPGQISLSTLPSIQENNTLELEEDSNECLWNSSSYMADKVGGELVALLMDTTANNQIEKRWPYAVNGNNHSLTSPGDSWSSAETNSEDCFHAYEPETCSKRSSAALSGCSDDTNESHPVGTDFTRDFYRLVKFESTKSLASISSRSAAGCLPEHCDREQALHSVLTFIAEQQLYCNTREEIDSRPSSVLHEDQTKDFNIEGPPQNIEDLSNGECELTTNSFDSEKLCSEKFNENYVNFKQLRAELALNEQNSNKVNNHLEEPNDCIMNSVICDDTSYLNVQNSSLIESYSVTDEDVTLTNNDSSDNTIQVVNDEIIPTDLIIDKPILNSSDNQDAKIVTEMNSSTIELSDREHLSPSSGMTESQTSSVSTPDTIVSRIPRRQISRSSTPLKSSPKASPTHSKKIPQPIPQPKPAIKSKIPSKDYRNNSKSKSVKSTRQTSSKLKETSNKPIITSERLPPCTSGLLGSSVIDGPPHRAISFHERATSKDVIDELNRMIRKGEENNVQEHENVEKNARLDEACRPTGWIHVEKTVDLNDPKARASILDVMIASSDSSPTSSCGGSVSSESTDDPQDYGHLHRIHRFNRQKKASAVRPQHAVLRYVQYQRPSIIGRDDFYVRYGEREREAVSSFDFLDEFSTGSLTSSIDEETTADTALDEEEF